jgi:dihydroneopterin aldolase
LQVHLQINMISTLTFNNIKLYGYHGIYDVEVKVGCYFNIKIEAKLRVNFSSEQPTLDNTVNYEQLYSDVKIVFSKREDLIENAAINILYVLKSRFHQVEKWKVCIEKQNPLGAGVFSPEFCVEG